MNPPINLTVEQGNLPSIAILEWEDPQEGTTRGKVRISSEASDKEKRSLINFKVYRDGAMIQEVAAGTNTYTDTGLPLGIYDYHVTAVYSGDFESVASNEVEFIVSETDADDGLMVYATRLLGNSPNPFNPVTTIHFSLTEATHVNIEIYNLKGQKVKTFVNGTLEAGNHSMVWNGKDNNNRDVPSGVYFYKMQSGKYTSTKKMIMLK